MERSRILGAGAWTAIGLAVFFAAVSASAGRHTATTAKACPAKAAVAASHECCAAGEPAAPAAVAARSAAKSVAEAAPGTKPARAASGVNGVVVALDPESGQLGMPSAQQMAELESKIAPTDDLNYSDVGLTPVYGPDGSITLDLQGRYQEFATIHIALDGKRVLGCSDKSNAGLPMTPSAPAALEEK
jgi:hypothetical protein